MLMRPRAALSGGGVGPHNAWSVLRIASMYPSYYGIAEVTFGGVVAAGGTPIASSQYSNEAYYAPKAFDADLSTGWRPATVADSWIGYEFPDPIIVDQVTIGAWSALLDPNATPTSFAVRYREGSEWVTSWEVFDEPAWSAGESRTFHKP